MAEPKSKGLDQAQYEHDPATVQAENKAGHNLVKNPLKVC
jgi:hypothetical protein